MAPLLRQLALLLTPWACSAAAARGRPVYDNTAKCCSDTKTNVHIVCHTHDDVGWLKTVDQYYLGSNNSIQHAGVQYILDSVTEALEKDPHKKFTYVEQAFFSRWWFEQTPEKQESVKNLVRSGQLVFTNGGWCMHDEATTHYVGMIDQTALGHRFIAKVFGPEALPRVGWQIDPFGHSSTQAALLSAEVGFDALYFGRIDYQDMDLRKADARLEFIWDASPSLGLEAGVFTGIFPSGNYGPPPGYCFDNLCNDQPINDDSYLYDVNVQHMVDTFVNWTLDTSKFTHGNNIMVQMGSDFQYENANMWYKNLDKLIHYLNKDGRLNVFYSTPIEYTEARNKEGLSFTTKTDDFFPYADGKSMYWTGYFTSRAALKRLERVTSGFLQTARRVEAVVGLSRGDASESQLQTVEEAHAILQHHDAVAGTAKQHVSYDYAERVDKGYTEALEVFTDALGHVLGASASAAPLSFCKLVNESVCALTQTATGSGDTFLVAAYNPLPRTRSTTVRIPVSVQDVSVYAKGNTDLLASDVLEAEVLPNVNGAAQFSLVFQATDLPPLGLKTFVVKPAARRVTAMDGKGSSTPAGDSAGKRQPHMSKEDILLSNEHVAVTFSGQTGRIASIRRHNGPEVAITQDFLFYKGFDADGSQTSGAYIFRPKNNTVAVPINAGPIQIDIVKGKHTMEVRQTFSDWAKQTVRIPPGADYLELEWTVGPIPIGDKVGKEVITRFSSSVASDHTLYTDSNGREFLKRNINVRPTWNLTVNEPVAGNYYPVNAAAFIRDSRTQLSVVVDRSQGVASLASGQLEVMVQRRLLKDDYRGVGEPLNETVDGIDHQSGERRGDGVVVRGRHLLLLSDVAHGVAEVRKLMDEEFFPVALSFSDDKSVVSSAPAHFAAVSHELPINVQLMTLRLEGDGKALVRLSHQFAVGEDPELSKPADVDLALLFPGLFVIDVTELTLTASKPKAKETRLTWKTADGRVAAKPRQNTDRSLTEITLQPMQIRTFEVTVARSGREMLRQRRNEEVGVVAAA